MLVDITADAKQITHWERSQIVSPAVQDCDAR